MTENKRFKLKYINEQHISANLYDNKTFIGAIGIGEELIVELLNDLSQENEQLKKDWDSVSHNWALMYDEAKNKVEELSKENKQLKAFIRNEFPKSYKHILEGFE